MPALTPQVPPNALIRALGRWILRLGGWKMEGEIPNLPRAVLIGAPHSSNWDGLWGFASKMALGLDVRVLGKDSLFKVPLLGFALRQLGVLPVNRNAAQGVVEQAAAMLRERQKLWFGLAPEGTRKAVKDWKTGFWKIAKSADVPVVTVYFHYGRKIFGFGPVFTLSDDMQADIARIRAWYAQISQGKRRNV